MEVLTPDEIVRLTPSERLALIAQLWDSLEQEQLPLTSAQEAELERRLSSIDSPLGEARRNGVTWASLKAELERRCPECIRSSSLRPRGIDAHPSLPHPDFWRFVIGVASLPVFAYLEGHGSTFLPRR